MLLYASAVKYINENLEVSSEAPHDAPVTRTFSPPFWYNWATRHESELYAQDDTGSVGCGIFTVPVHALLPADIADEPFITVNVSKHKEPCLCIAGAVIDADPDVLVNVGVVLFTGTGIAISAPLGMEETWYSL